eukprot:scaffold110065_cov41-Tisochrysis_lutea.AAC.2
MQTIRLAGWPGPWRLLQEGHIALRCVHTSLAINGAVDAHNFRDRIAIFIKIRVGSATHFVSTARVTFFLAADSCMWWAEAMMENIQACARMVRPLKEADVQPLLAGMRRMAQHGRAYLQGHLDSMHH